MSRQRHSSRSVLLSDDSSRLLLRTHHFANSRRIVSTADDTETGTAATSSEPRKMKKALATAFRCPSCKRADSVECRIDDKNKAAEASCWACGASYSAAAHALTEPVDVYSEWTDMRRCAKNGVDCDGDVMMWDA